MVPHHKLSFVHKDEDEEEESEEESSEAESSDTSSDEEVIDAAGGGQSARQADQHVDVGLQVIEAPEYDAIDYQRCCGAMLSIGSI